MILGVLYLFNYALHFYSHMLFIRLKNILGSGIRPFDHKSVKEEPQG